MSEGIFIVFEGGEGTGKTTQIKLLKQKLEAQGRKVHLTWEPGGTALGEKIRSLLLDPNVIGMSAKCEALLYSAARSEHVHTVIRPKLNEGFIVLCDRYWDASRAYQGIARSLGIPAIDALNTWATDGLLPHKVFLFDLNPQIGLERALNRSGTVDRLESEGLGFHESVRNGYSLLAEMFPKTHKVIDASKSLEDIEKILWIEIQETL